MFLFLFQPLSSNHAVDSSHYERNAQYLSHVKRQIVLECYLVFFCKFDEESCCENQCKTQSKEKACANFSRCIAAEKVSNTACLVILSHSIMIEMEHYEEEDEVGNGFI